MTNALMRFVDQGPGTITEALQLPTDSRSVPAEIEVLVDVAGHFDTLTERVVRVVGGA